MGVVVWELSNLLSYFHSCLQVSRNQMTSAGFRFMPFPLWAQRSEKTGGERLLYTPCMITVWYWHIYISFIHTQICISSRKGKGSHLRLLSVYQWSICARLKLGMHILFWLVSLSSEPCSPYDLIRQRNIKSSSIYWFSSIKRSIYWIRLF